MPGHHRYVDWPVRIKRPDSFVECCWTAREKDLVAASDGNVDGRLLAYQLCGCVSFGACILNIYYVTEAYVDAIRPILYADFWMYRVVRVNCTPPRSVKPRSSCWTIPCIVIFPEAMFKCSICEWYFWSRRTRFLWSRKSEQRDTLVAVLTAFKRKEWRHITLDMIELILEWLPRTRVHL